MKNLPALNWIIDFLNREGISYVVCGGLAAQAYGATRELNDIDLYVPDEHLPAVAKFGASYITYGPEHHRGEQWDLVYVKFDYHGQDVEVGSAKECKIRKLHSSDWITKKIQFDNYELHELYGVQLRVMAKDELVAYKCILGREVDLEDVAQINGSV